MVRVLTSAEFDRWLKKLKDSEARARILVRITRLAMLLAGGDKSTQSADIKRAKEIADQWSDR